VTYDHDGLRRLVRRNGPEGSTAFFYADPFDPFRPSAYRAPGEALTSLHHDDRGLLVALERGGSLWIVATDQVGSPRLVIEAATGTTVKAVAYDTFGRVLSDSAPAFRLPIGFAGGIADPVTGLVCFGLRDYDPAAGRWTARDPAFLQGGQLNLFEYVKSDPARMRDPWGLWCIGGSAFAGLGGGAKFCGGSDGYSVCGELGFGLGNSIDISPLAKADENFIGFEAGLKANVGNVISLGCEGSYGINPDVVGDGNPCNNGRKFSPDCKAGAFGADASLLKGWLDPGAGIESLNVDPKGFWESFQPKEKLFEFQGKATTKACASF